MTFKYIEGFSIVTASLQKTLFTFLHRRSARFRTVSAFGGSLLAILVVPGASQLDEHRLSVLPGTCPTPILAGAKDT
jgi:hypothetical protein